MEDREASSTRLVTVESVQQSDRGRGIFPTCGQRLELVDRVDLGAHGDVGHPLEDHLDHHRHAVFGHPGLGLLDGRAQVFLLEHAQRLAARPSTTAT